MLTCGVVLGFVSLANAQVTTGWKTMVTSGTTLGEPQGAAVRTGLPPGVVDPSLTPSILNTSAPTGSEPNGFTALYLLNTGDGEDNTGTNWSHLEAEGGNFGSFQGQMWTRFSGLLTTFKTAADAAFGADRWTIRRMWLGVDPATGISVGCNPGLVSLAEVTALGIKGGVADWGDKSQANTEDSTISPTELPAGYHGFYMGPTQASLCVGVPAQQDAVNPDFFNILNLTGGPQVFPTGSIAFQRLIVGPNSRVRPVQDSFVLYWAPIDDYVGGQGYNVAISYDGFTGAAFGFGPYLLFELVKQDVVTGPAPPTTPGLVAEAPFTATPGPTCSFTLTASDVDLDVLSFTIVGTGSLGGTITPTGPIVGTNLGGGNYSLNITYNVPANVRGLDTFTYTVSDGTNFAPGVITINVRGPASKNSVAFGANNGSQTDPMRVYTAPVVPDGMDPVNGGKLDRVLAPASAFPQSTEFDNAGGIRHNPNGNILALSFGPAPSGPGTLMAFRANPQCDSVGGRIIFSFASPNVITGPSRTVGLSVSPDNTKLAVFGTNQARLYILNYNSASWPPTVSLNKEVDLSMLYATAPSVGTTWLDNNNVLVLDSDANLHKIQVFPTTSVTQLCPNPRSLPGQISSADIEYNPEVSPYIFVAIGTFSGGASNTLYVCDTAGNRITMHMEAEYAAFDDGLAETFREIGLDCFGNLFIGTFVDNSARVNLKYLPNAKAVSQITGGDSSLEVWRTIPTPGEGTSNFSGMDVAAGTTIGGGGTCANASPAASFINDRTSVNTGCTVTLRCVDYNAADTITFNVTNPGSAGGTLTPFGAITTNGNERTQQAVYTPPLGFRGVECFSYKATDNGTPPLQNDSNITSVCVNVRGDAMDGTVAFGGDLFDQNQTMRLYYGPHVPNGGTDAVEDVANGRSFASSTEFDNYGGVRHNPAGNLFALRTGSDASGGLLYVYPTKAACNGNPATILLRFDVATLGVAERVSGLSINPSNNRMAVYGFTTRKIFFLDYTPGAPGDIGFGGTLAATVSYAGTSVDVSTVATQPNRSTGTTFLNDTTVLWVNSDTGDLYTVDTGGTVTLRRACPRTINNLSTADVEYNPAISSDKIYVAIGEFLNPTTTNTLYIVDRDGPNNIAGDGDDWSIVTQSGGASYTDHSAAGTGTIREIGLSTGGKLFMSTFVESANNANIRYIDNATTPGGITDNSSIIWNVMDAGQTLTSFSGMDVAAGVPATCALPGDTNGDGKRDGKDIQLFTHCYLAALGAAPPMSPAGCVCADVAVQYKALNAADLTAFVALLLAP